MSASTPAPAPAPKLPAWLISLQARHAKWVARRREARMADAFNAEIPRMIRLANLLDQSPELRAMWRRALRVRSTEELSNPTPRSKNARVRQALKRPGAWLGELKE